MSDTSSINVIKSGSNYSYEFKGDVNNNDLSNIGAGGSGPNVIRFSGVTGDSNGFYSLISERFHNEDNEASELFIGKAKETSQ